MSELQLTTTTTIPKGISLSTRQARRLEYKFLVPITMLTNFRKVIKPYIYLDEFSESRPDKQYTVRSIYYETRGFTCYVEKVEGFRFKKKFRIRGYNTTDPNSVVFLEIKSKNQDFISKSRAPIRWNQIKSVFTGYNLNTTSLPFIPETKEAEAAGRFLYHYYRKKMMPVVLIAYEREAFYSRFDRTLRITFDKNVRSRLYPSLDSLYVDRGMNFVMPNYFVFEVKFYGGLPQWIRSIVTKFDIQRLAVSKFAMGIDCHRVERKFLRGVAHTVEFPEINNKLIVQNGKANSYF
jgi:hypothetical protein